MKRLICLAAALLMTAAISAPGSAQVDTQPNYMLLMQEAAVKGDLASGRHYNNLRNRKIDQLGMDLAYIHFDDLYLLAKIIYAEAGSDWLTDHHRMMVGNVLLNRVASPEFPGSISECVYQRGQYYSPTSSYFANLRPSVQAVICARQLLEGQRVCPESVVFQANFRQGSGTYEIISDRYLGSSYFCFSAKPWLYSAA